MAADLADYRWLISSAAAPWLAAVAADRAALTTVAGRLRRDLSPTQTHLVLEQIELRRRAAAKFTWADRMFFTPRSLEQATSEAVASWKAERFASRAAAQSDPGKWADLCSGIGGDLIALAQRQTAIGVERDEPVAELAQANLAACGLEASAVRCLDVRRFPVEEVPAWHLDPDRRTSRGRVAQPAQAEPGIDVIEGMLARNASAAVKLAPAAAAPRKWTDQCELEWISDRGECKQQVAWFGLLARSPGVRSATILGGDRPPRTISSDAAFRPPPAETVSRFIYEPDAAVLAAGLSGALAAEHELAALGNEFAYLTGDRAIFDAAAPGFEVLEVICFDRKLLKSLLRRRNIGRPEIKKRGFDVDLERLHRELRGPGDEPATLLLTPLAGKTLAILARRLNGHALPEGANLR